MIFNICHNKRPVNYGPFLVYLGYVPDYSGILKNTAMKKQNTPKYLKYLKSFLEFQTADPEEARNELMRLRGYLHEHFFLFSVTHMGALYDQGLYLYKIANKKRK